MVKHTRALRAVEWSNTLKLPRSSLPARSIAERRSNYLKTCTDDLYAWQAVHRPASNQFVLHDGPPYANGSLHVGHALNKVLKDIICRFQLSTGKRIHYIPGWDCHGLPIEIKALQSQDAHTRMRPVDIRNAARQLAATTVEQQKKNFREWAIMGDWDNAWNTMQKGFELKQLEVFKEMVQKGLIYRQFKPVYWSPSSGTALAEAELEYDENHISRAAYVKFEVVKLPPVLQHMKDMGKLYALIWTTTPWTLPANSAIAVHNDFDYCVIRLRDQADMILIATARLEEVLAARDIDFEQVEILMDNIKGIYLADSTRYTNSLRGKDTEPQPLVHADFVTLTSGSGLVHMAPGHGFDDYNVCRSHNINAFTPVDNEGCFTDAAYPDQPDALSGKDAFKSGSKAVIELLKANQGRGNLIWATHNYRHKYPIDWRTKQPVMIRATAQWFADVDSIKSAALNSLQNVKFIPETGKTRLESFINGRSQWCISRQRAWGVPIPALYQKLDGHLKPIMTATTVEHIIKVIAHRGIDAWWTDTEDEPAWVSPELPRGSYIRGKDTMDVWFDSGTTWTQLPSDRSPPADVYIEGTDQHRGWFQSSLLTYVAHQVATAKDGSFAAAPFKRLITHGFILDQDGRKMSKSLGNVVSPNQIIDGTLLGPMKKRKGQKVQTEPSFDALGPDALRLWVSSSDYTHDVVIGQPVLKAVNTSLHKFRVTFKWLLGALEDYGRNEFASSAEFLAAHGHVVDRIIEHQLAKTLHTAHSAYTLYEPYKAANAITKFVNLDLSAFYFESAKDPLYAGDSRQRLRVQHTCYRIFQRLLQMLAPLVPLLVAEVTDYASPTLQNLLKSDTHEPFRSIWRPPKGQDIDVIGRKLEQQLEWLTTAHAAIKVAQEEAREHKQMGSGLQCRVIISLPPNTAQAAIEFFRHTAATGELQEIFVVSGIDVRIERRQEEHSDVESSFSSASQAGRGEAKELSWKYARDFELRSEEPSPPSSPSMAVAASGSTEAQMVKARAIVLPPEDHKCPRCWRYVAKEADTLCQRCEDVIGEQEDGAG